VGASWQGSTGTYSFADLGANFYFNGTNELYLGSDFATKYRQISGTHAWYNAPSGTAGNAITFTQAMTLDASGNLGIGTTSPNQKLSVTGSISLGVGTTAGGLTMTNADGVSGVTDARLLIGNSSSTYGALRMVFNATTNVSIDTVTWGSTATQTNLLLNANGGKIGMGLGSINASGGVLQLASGITFPATQVASSDANTLDDYEEGTFTPSLTNFTVIGTTSHTGFYTKVGRQVTVVMQLAATTSISSTGSSFVNNLPFPVSVPSIGSMATMTDNSGTGSASNGYATGSACYPGTSSDTGYKYITVTYFTT
jgi:hypothetical protein